MSILMAPRCRWAIAAVSFFLFGLPLSATAGELSNLQSLLEEMTKRDLDYAAQWVDPNTGQIMFGGTPRSMRGGELDTQFTPKKVKDEFWIHPDTKLYYASSPRRPVKAWHSGFISSFARGAQHAKGEDREKYLQIAEAVAHFFMNSFLTKREYPYGVHRMWRMNGSLVSWEELKDTVKDFDLFGTPWFNADRFGAVHAAPWLARAGWGDLDFLVEVFTALYETTQKAIYLQVAEDLASPFINYRKVHLRGDDDRRDFCFLVFSEPTGPIYYGQKYFYAHDAEGAINAYFKLAQIEPDTQKRQDYETWSLRLADLWLRMMEVSVRTDEPGWPPYWMYSLDYFLADKPISVRPIFTNWIKESMEESRAQYCGADFFRIDHVPQGLLMAYEKTKELKYLEGAKTIVTWIHAQPNFDKESVALKRVPESRPGFLSAHNVHSDSPYMRASLILTHAMLAKALAEAGLVKESREAKNWAIRGMKALLDDRVAVKNNNVPRYSLEVPELTFHDKSGKQVPIYLSKEVWLDPQYEAAGLYNELYGYVYDYLWTAFDILETLKA